jgi:uncharacterized membrane protein YeaQ/YmgE (transglycosylase-associated protein family)
MNPPLVSSLESGDRVSKGLTLTAILAALYTTLAVVSSWVWGVFTHGMDALVLRSLFVVVLVSYTRRLGTGVLFGFTAGALLELTTPTPVLFYLLLSLTTYGLVNDAILNYFRQDAPLTLNLVLLTTIVASVGMAVVALAVFTLVGFFPPAVIPVIWMTGILRDVILGVVGAGMGWYLVRSLPKHFN